MKKMNGWSDFFHRIKAKDYASSLRQFLAHEYATKTVYPPREKMFAAFDLVPLEKIKVVIIGQDPYHEPLQAMGLAFSVPSGVRLPPSLINIQKEIENDLQIRLARDGDLTYLAKQGVFLLNAFLTVRKGEPLSHHIPAYDEFFCDVLRELDRLSQPIVFLLWGRFARQHADLLANPRHLVLTASHPSPLSASRGGFFHQHHFSKANAFLQANGVPPIAWGNKEDYT